MRGTFANVRIQNLMVPGVVGGMTLYQPAGEQMSIYDASLLYRDLGVPLLIFAGQEYGTGSSRDWAAKGTALLGVKAVIAQSFERIHRSNLVGMGVLPCQFKEGVNAQTLGLDGTETFDLTGLEGGLRPQMDVTLQIQRANGDTQEVPLTLRIDTPIEVDYYLNGGILPYVLRQLLEEDNVQQAANLLDTLQPPACRSLTPLVSSPAPFQRGAFLRLEQFAPLRRLNKEATLVRTKIEARRK